MKRFICIILISAAITGCTSQESNEWKRIRASHSIEEFESYLITHPTSIHIEEIIDSLRFLWSDTIIWHSPHHPLNIYLDQEGRVYFRDHIVNERQLIEKIIEWVTNPSNSANMPGKRGEIIEGIGEFNVSTATIYMRASEEYNHNQYSEVILTIIEAIRILREDLSQYVFSKEYERLNAVEKLSIDHAYPLQIHFEKD